MKTHSLTRYTLCSIGTVLLSVAPGLAATFTSDTTIGIFDTMYDDADIIISNCVVTVDGPHSFASLQIHNGGRLTHTQVPAGLFEFSQSITSELHVLSSTNPATLNLSNVVTSSIIVRDETGTITYSNGVDYLVDSSQAPLTTIARTDGSTIPDGSTVGVDYSTYAAVPSGLNLSVTGDAVIEAGAFIDVNAKGYGGGLGPGHGSSEGNPRSGSGGGHGGYGGLGSSNTLAGAAYDSTSSPADKGSGGGAGSTGAGGIGGGAVQLFVGGVLHIDGSITATGANATNSRSGGGAGGGIWLSAQTISGTGTIVADGGAGEPVRGGGGGGGRIAVYFATNLFSGTIAARGGGGFMSGGAGTVYTRNTTEPAALVLVDNAGRPGTNTLLNFPGSADLTVRGQARATWSSVLTLRNLLVESNGYLVGASLSSQRMILSVSSNATIASGGGILFDGVSQQIQGAGASTNAGALIGWVGGGGGYGGAGGAGGIGPVGGISYGQVANPTDPGSRGGQGTAGIGQAMGASGGGAIQISVSGVLTLNGTVSANGARSPGLNGGGGSGGSVWLSAGTVTGAGAIAADGGAGQGLGGGGGGGRLALYYVTNTFFGTISARGGTGAVAGGAGTIAQFPRDGVGSVIVDNGGQRGAVTTLGSSSISSADFTITGGASLVAPPNFGPVTFNVRTLLVASNSVLLVTNVSTTTLTVLRDATVEAGGWIDGDGEGYPSTQSGNGGVTNSPIIGVVGGGGGHGGYGSSGTGRAPAGVAFDTLTQPLNRGGNGAPVVTGGIPQGGPGGGVIRLLVTGTLRLDGRLSVDGHDGNSQNSGGGAGGALWISAATISGSGTISANGGKGIGLGGSGGGGRVAIYSATNNFAGTLVARGGGSGTDYGGAGTIYLSHSVSIALLPEVILDNGGAVGALSTAPSPGLADLTVIGGARLAIMNPSLRDLVVGSNSWLYLSNSLEPFAISSNATVMAGGGILADATVTAGSGQGQSGAGGGHGGMGGRSSSGANGGISYDSASEPLAFGSRGGSGFAGLPGGNGGGLVHLSVSGTLVVDGLISANGGASVVTNGGGGSGGTINLSANRFAGSGLIRADGGSGYDNAGGGGGGGRIAILTSTNTFSGHISARGGGGFAWGGAGTIWVASNKGNQRAIPQLLVDNGGPLGALSTASYSGTPDLTVGGGAVVSLPLSVAAPGIALPVHDLLVNSNGFLVTSNLSTSLHNATILAGGAFLADGTGYGSGQGLGSGRSLNGTGSGGGHGGVGGTSAAGLAGGIAYDSVAQPNSAGSGGGYTVAPVGGSGGGVIILSVTGTLLLNGTLSANGLMSTNSGGGGGAGGTIRLSVGTLSGSGSITANGGAGAVSGGGGGGGRIAILYANKNFQGLISAFGGAGAGAGGAGTIYLKANNQNLAQVILDNGGSAGALSSFSGAGTVDLTLQNGATAGMANNQPPIHNLLIASTGCLFATNVTAFAVNNAIIQTGGRIAADGSGNFPGTGLGAGHSITVGGITTGSGAGHGGFGAPSSGGAVGGLAYDALYGLTSSMTAGSGGGNGSGTGTNAYGGGGGGLVTLSATGDLVLDGEITADGTTGPGLNSGGGAGGSIRLVVGRISGNGRISANGGDANGPGGGGGAGGRVFINIATNEFIGTITAFGGTGFAAGAAGTIFLQPVKGNLSQLIVDNGDADGALSTLGSSAFSGLLADLFIQHRGNLLLSTYPFRNVLVASNSWLTVTNAGTFAFSGDATIEAGGGLKADGAPNGAGQGSGAGHFFYSAVFGYTGGGGAHGGFGSPSVAGAAGGFPYDSIVSPNQPGSDGGGSPAAIGGQGGRLVRLTVPGTLHLDGRISADGHAGFSLNGGGGSGGSLWLTAGTLAGTGSISADGGAASGYGGGGGGGRIALYYQSNAFTGPITARGGAGIVAAGGAGTIYLHPNNQNLGQLIVDNGGPAGVNTPIPNLGALDLAVGGGAAIYPSDFFLILSNLSVNDGGVVTSGPGATNLNVVVLSNVVIGAGGSVSVDGAGFAQGLGPGAGLTAEGYGSGGGYGGMGGYSAMAPGGGTYGSPTQPIDLGSGGGLGVGPVYNPGSAGGGAIRLNVGGTLTVDGTLSAGGYDGLQDGSGGGSGGSIWVSARTVRGAGRIAADGGAGEFYGGGGGGGGRIAVYYLTNPGHTNNFIGEMTAFGGEGEYWGDDGSVFFSAGVPLLHGIAQTPSGIVSNAVSNIDVVFDGAVNALSASGGALALTTPNGLLDPVYITVTALGPASIRFSFPPQTAVGSYSFTVGPQIEDVFGRPLAQAYAGTFSISLPTVEGRITDGSGQPVPGIVIQQSGAFSFATSDANGHYALGFVPGSTFTVAPVAHDALCAPGSRTYVGQINSVADQDYVIVTSVGAVTLTAPGGTNLVASWQGLSGLTYQLYYSTDLVEWMPYGSPISGSNAVIEVSLPPDDAPAKFFRVKANN